jgi:hypothetical protein
MAYAGLKQPEDPLARLKTGLGTVQNTGGQVPGTAPLANRPVASPGVNTAPPGPVPLQNVQSRLQGIRAGEQAPGTAPPPPVPLAGAAPAVPGGVIKIGSAANPPAPAAPPPPPPDLYGRGGGGGLEDQIRSALTGAFSGSTSKGFIDRAKSALGSATEGQRAQSVRRIDDDAIRRGIFQSGIPAELAAAADTTKAGSFAAGLSDILNNAEQQDIQGRQFATGAATNLLGMNREYDAAAQARADANRGGGGGGPETVTIIDPDTGQAYELPADALG